MYHLCVEEIFKNSEKSTAESRIKQIDPIYFETCSEILNCLKLATFS
jgi:hypothetical protein